MSENILALEPQKPSTINVAAATLIVEGRMRGLFILLPESPSVFQAGGCGNFRIACLNESADDFRTLMLLPVFRDLIKPQWRAVLEELKRSGGQSASELSRATDGSYMAVKTHCEELTKAGYVTRARLPRTAIGRPEIFYSLAAKADALFPQAGVDFTLSLLDEMKRMYGESAPEKLLFQYFQKQQESWTKPLAPLASVADKAEKLAKLRSSEGFASSCECGPAALVRIVELHNPLQRIFGQYPRAITMELRMLEALLGTRITRHELTGGRESQPRIVFEIS